VKKSGKSNKKKERIAIGVELYYGLKFLKASAWRMLNKNI
jgi:hypothetical protein